MSRPFLVMAVFCVRPADTATTVESELGRGSLVGSDRPLPQQYTELRLGGLPRSGEFMASTTILTAEPARQQQSSLLK